MGVSTRADTKLARPLPMMKTIPIVISMFIFMLESSPALAANHPLSTLEVGHWFEVVGSDMESVNPCPQISCPPGNINSVMKAWSGGSYDSTNQRLIVWGGGHGDYAGNELYAFSVKSNSWSRLTDPSTNTGGDPQTYLYPDGLPRSLHTHNYIEYVPGRNAFVSFGGVAPYPASGTTPRVMAYDFGLSQWVIDYFPEIPAGGTSRYANAVYDESTNSIWYQSGENAQLHRLNLNTEQWSSHGKKSGWFSSYTVAAIDPTRKLFVQVGSGDLVVWDLNKPNNAPVSPQTTGSKFIESAKAPGFVFDPTIEKFVGWAGGSDVYSLDPSNWTWAKISAASTNTIVPTEPALNGTFGRFQYLPAWNAYVLVNATNEDVYYYRLGEFEIRSTPPPNFRLK